VPDESKLEWAVAAMFGGASRIKLAKDEASAFTAVGETVWWVTSVDDALRPHHRRLYKRNARGYPALLTTMRGLHHARHRILDGLAIEQFVEPMPDAGLCGAYRWCPVSAPIAVKHQADWKAYQGALVNRNVLQAFDLCIDFLQMLAADVTLEGPDAKTVYAARVQRGLHYLDEWPSDPSWVNQYGAGPLDPESISFPEHHILDILADRTGTYSEHFESDSLGIDWLRDHGFAVLEGDERSYPILTALWRKAVKLRQVWPSNSKSAMQNASLVMIPLGGICKYCKWYQGLAPNCCKPFPKGIPKMILGGQVDHRYPFEGDHGCQFEQDPDSTILSESDVMSLLPGVYGNDAPPVNSKLWFIL
jgi:hypothetical protein